MFFLPLSSFCLDTNNTVDSNDTLNTVDTKDTLNTVDTTAMLPLPAYVSDWLYSLNQSPTLHYTNISILQT